MVAVNAASGAAASQEAVPARRRPAASGPDRGFKSSKVEVVRDPASGRVAVKVMDDATGEVVRCIPPEKLLRVLAGIRDAIGLLLDDSA